MLVMHAAKYLDGVTRSADASFPVAGVQALPRVGEVPDHGAVIVGYCPFGELDDEGDGGGLLPGSKDLVCPCLGGDVERGSPWLRSTTSGVT
jgi:hypothetical protein